MYRDRDFLVIAVNVDRDDCPIGVMLQRIADQIGQNLAYSRAVPFTPQCAARVDLDRSKRMRR